ncbi:hypothetical protein OV203_49095 [Nannocystis sp. ILAH1]|uniref:hypothetical protein n=1 Tax=unclassified Nannocystis TaxID=2627009 RepID=UPI00226DFC60|nr:MULTISPECIES: hypothetical protein [unclassified Nannocystis]MCY0995181.1 hypothetical protein [Nannocystis sp. ILAH1]MCY1069879.1 hypothetical protein [Nannocystis sp. RBIL2]
MTSLGFPRTLFLGLALAACGGDKSETTADTSSSSGPTTSGTSDTDPPTPTTTGEPDVCADPSDLDIGPAVTLTLRNGGAAPIFLVVDDGCGGQPFSVAPEGGSQLHTHALACEACATAALQCGCDDGCGNDEIIQLDPDGRLELVWAGDHFEASPVPSACVEQFCGFMTCLARRQVAPARLDIVAFATSAVGECGDACTCTADAEGWCVLAGQPAGVQRLAEAQLDYPAATALELVFP